MTIIKEGVQGHFLAFLEEKLHVKCEYSMAGIYYFIKVMFGRTFYVAMSRPDVAINLGFKHKIVECGVLRMFKVPKGE